MATFATTKEKLVNAWNGVNAPTAPVGGTMPASGTPTGSPAAPATPTFGAAGQYFGQGSGQAGFTGTYKDPASGKYMSPRYETKYNPQTGDMESVQVGWYSADGQNVGDTMSAYTTTGQADPTNNTTIADTSDTWQDKLIKGGILAGTGAIAGNALGLWGAPGAEAASAGAGAGAGGAAPGVFNAAVDSQLANVGIDALGGAGTALAGYTGGAALPATAGLAGAASTLPATAATSLGTAGTAATTAATGLGAATPAIAAAGTGLTLDSVGKWISDNKNTLGLGAAAIGALGAGSGGGTAPTPKTPEQVAADQLAINKGIIDQTAPLLHPNSVNPTGSSNWTKGPDGQWTNTQTLNAGSQGLFDSSTQGLQSLLGGINPNEKAPELIKDAGGKYSQQLADAIYARMERQFKPVQDTARSKLETRLAERGFAPGTDGWDKEMNRFDQQIGGQIQDAANQAQITAATQGLNEANFTNNALLGEFNATGNNRATLAQLLSGARNGPIAGLNTLPTSGSSPALPTTSAAGVNATNYGAELDKYNNDSQRQNDLWATLMKYGLNLFGK